MKAAIFDLDGTLLDSVPFWTRALPQFFSNLGFDYFSEVPNISHMTVAEACDYLTEKYTLKITGEELNSRFVNELKVNYASKLDLKENAIKILEDAKQIGIKMCLATATIGSVAELVINRFEMWKYFDFILTSDFTDYNKNEEEYFYYISDRLSVMPNSCIVFEDSLHSIDTAKRAGMKVVALTKDSPKRDLDRIIELADVAVPEIKDIDMYKLYNSKG